MKINIKKIKFKKRFKKKQNFPKAGLFWDIAVAFFFLLVIFGAIFGYILHQKVDKDPFYTEPIEIHTDQEKEEKLNNSLIFFQGRTDKALEIIFSPSRIVDPAL